MAGSTKSMEKINATKKSTIKTATITTTTNAMTTTTKICKKVLLQFMTE